MRKLLVPSLVDIFFVVLLWAAFARPGGWQTLLMDGDTGWHIRTGELVLATGHAPLADGFSFTRPGQEWFAWEWLSDVVFAAAFARHGLAGVAVLSGVVLSLSVCVIFAWLLRRGIGLWLSLAVAMAVFSASSVHYLARPHIFSILLYAVCLWILAEDRARPGWLLWTLPPICALWANLHGGFVAWLATLVVAAVVALFEGRRRNGRRYALAALLGTAATVVNPYGWHLHRHILSYLRSSWILDHVQEFQSPSIRSEGMVVFALLLLAGVALASRTMARGEWFEGVLAILWAFAALRSARHIPFLAIASAPVVATECALWWKRRAEGSPVASLCRSFWDLGQDFGRRGYATIWLPVLGGVLLAASSMAPVGFPPERFPVKAVEANAAVLVEPAMPRVLSSDQWSDYLIFDLYPRQRVFFDGRSDFYGPELGADYRTLQTGTGRWRELLDRYGFELALLPNDWPLSTMLDREPGWHEEYRDRVAVLYRRERTAGSP